MTDDRNASPPSGEERLQRSPRGSRNQIVRTFAILGAGLIGFAAIAVVDLTIRRSSLAQFRVAPLRLRVVALSSVVMIVATRWAVERAPW